MYIIILNSYNFIITALLATSFQFHFWKVKQKIFINTRLDIDDPPTAKPGPPGPSLIAEYALLHSHDTTR